MKVLTNKFFIFGTLFFLLVTIPVTLYFVKKTQEQRSSALASSSLSFSPSSITKNVGDEFTLDVVVDPGENLASSFRLNILYDASKFRFEGITKDNKFPVVTEGPTKSENGSVGSVVYTFGIGNDITQALQDPMTIATIRFTVLDGESGSSQISFDPSSFVLSVKKSQDNPGENVLASRNAATITVQGATQPTPTPTTAVNPSPTPTSAVNPSATPTRTPTPSATPTTAVNASPTPTTAVNPTATPTRTPTPTSTQTGSNPTATPTSTQLAQGPTSTPTPVQGTPAANKAPTCNSLTADRTTTGRAPYSLTFTASGTDTDGRITKVTFNLGNGITKDVTSGGLIGSASVNVPLAATYNAAGNYNVTAIMTDNSGATSSSCTLAVTITGGSSSAASGSLTTTPSAGAATATTPTPTLAPAGDFTTTLAIFGGLLLVILGGLLLLAL